MATKTSSKKSIKLGTGGRSLTLTLEPVVGTINYFFAFVDHNNVINDDGSRKRTWTGTIPAAQVPLKIRVVGLGVAEYKLGIDLPGTANDQNLQFTLTGGYHETTIVL